MTKESESCFLCLESKGSKKICKHCSCSAHLKCWNEYVEAQKHSLVKITRSTVHLINSVAIECPVCKQETVTKTKPSKRIKSFIQRDTILTKLISISNSFFDKEGSIYTIDEETIKEITKAVAEYNKSSNINMCDRTLTRVCIILKCIHSANRKYKERIDILLYQLTKKFANDLDIFQLFVDENILSNYFDEATSFILNNILILSSTGVDELNLVAREEPNRLVFTVKLEEEPFLEFVDRPPPEEDEGSVFEPELSETA